MQRTKNFTNAEKNDLLDIIFLHRHIVENKVTDNITTLQKDQAWTNITLEYNTKNKTGIRSEKNLRCCWDNIKRETRKYCAAHKRESYKTGGGVITLEKNDLFERAREIMGEVTVNGLTNPFDSDFDKENIDIVNTLLQEDTENDSTEIFSYLIENKEVNDWKSWDTKKLKLQKSLPLQLQDAPMTSKNVKLNKMKLKENNQTLDEAKTELIHLLQANEKDKKNYEIDLLKAKLEKEKLQIELLKISIEKEKTLKRMIEEEKFNINLIK